MPVNKYKITANEDIYYFTHYKDGLLSKIEFPGEPAIYYFLTHAFEVPAKEKILLEHKGNYEFQERGKKDTAKAEKKESLYKQCMSLYFEFYEKRSEMKPRVSAAEGAALKKIIVYLASITQTEEEILATFSAVLKLWDKLPEFFRSQIDIKQINSNLQKILYELRSQRDQLVHKEGRKERIRARRQHGE